MLPPALEKDLIDTDEPTSTSPKMLMDAPQCMDPNNEALLPARRNPRTDIDEPRVNES
jgi:hypothetical protein